MLGRVLRWFEYFETIDVSCTCWAGSHVCSARVGIVHILLHFPGCTTYDEWGLETCAYLCAPERLNLPGLTTEAVRDCSLLIVCDRGD